MIHLPDKLKRMLRGVPGLLWISLNVDLLIKVLQEQNRIEDLADDYHSRSKWNFEAPAERVRHSVALKVVEDRMGSTDWGDVLEIGCATGVFTAQLAGRCKKLIAADVSGVALPIVAKRCELVSNVSVKKLNVLTEAIAEKYDLIFVMGTLEFIHGSTRMSRVRANVAAALRDGGLLLMQEMRLVSEIEESPLVRWLGVGGKQYLKFLSGRDGLRLVSEQIDSDYVTALFQKTSQPQVTSRWKRFVPHSVKAAYRNFRAVRQLAGDLDFTSLRSLGRWWQTTKTIVKVYQDSLITPLGLKQLQNLAHELDISGIAGDFVECGVYRGGSAAMLGSTLAHSPFDRSLWLFDSFEGLPPAEAIDGPSAATMKQKLVGDEQNLRRLLNEVGVPKTKAHVCAGWFSETFPKVPIKRIALLHIDADWYASVKECLENFYDRVEPGGAVVLDDYGEWPGCKAALDDFAAARSLNIQLEGGKETPFFFRKTR